MSTAFERGEFASRTTRVGSFDTHYLEAGDGPPLVLLHGGEFGGSAEFGWENNIAALARAYRVIAPDWLGYGKSAKWFSFEDMRVARLEHLAEFLARIGIVEADFIGNSMGGSLLLDDASSDAPLFPIKRMVVVSAGGVLEDIAARRTLNEYDGTIESMEQIVQLLLVGPKRADRDYIRRRFESAEQRGAWECVAAARFRGPNRKPSGGSVADLTKVKFPTALVVGLQDKLRAPGFGRELVRQIPDAVLIEIEGAGHCPQIDQPAAFNERVLAYLSTDRR